MLGSSAGELCDFYVVYVAPVPGGVSQICQLCFARQPRRKVRCNSSLDVVNLAFWILVVFFFRAFKRKEVNQSKA